MRKGPAMLLLDDCKGGESPDHPGFRIGHIFPAVGQMRLKRKTVARIQNMYLIGNDNFDYPLEDYNQLISRMIHFLFATAASDRDSTVKGTELRISQAGSIRLCLHVGRIFIDSGVSFALG